jgi:cell division protein FtsB
MKHLYYRTIDFFWTLLSKEYRRQDKIAATIAARYKMAKAYKQSRRFGLSPIEALEDNDLYDTQARQELFETS